MQEDEVLPFHGSCMNFKFPSKIWDLSLFSGKQLKQAMYGNHMHAYLINLFFYLLIENFVVQTFIFLWIPYLYLCVGLKYEFDARIHIEDENRVSLNA